jgi:excinuclease UvrABC nuclease subunit
VSWNDILYISQNSILIPQHGGVYKVLRNDGEPGKMTRIYVGKAEGLRKRFLDHLSASEPNLILSGNLYNYECYFRFLLVPLEIDRSRLESELLAEFVPECNRRTE